MGNARCPKCCVLGFLLLIPSLAIELLPSIEITVPKDDAPCFLNDVVTLRPHQALKIILSSVKEPEYSPETVKAKQEIIHATTYKKVRAHPILNVLKRLRPLGCRDLMVAVVLGLQSGRPDLKEKISSLAINIVLKKYFGHDCQPGSCNDQGGYLSQPPKEVVSPDINIAISFPELLFSLGNLKKQTGPTVVPPPHTFLSTFGGTSKPHWPSNEKAQKPFPFSLLPETVFPPTPSEVVLDFEVTGDAEGGLPGPLNPEAPRPWWNSARFPAPPFPLQNIPGAVARPSWPPPGGIQRHFPLSSAYSPTRPLLPLVKESKSPLSGDSVPPDVKVSVSGEDDATIASSNPPPSPVNSLLLSESPLLSPPQGTASANKLPTFDTSSKNPEEPGIQNGTSGPKLSLPSEISREPDPHILISEDGAQNFHSAKPNVSDARQPMKNVVATKPPASTLEKRPLVGIQKPWWSPITGLPKHFVDPQQVLLQYPTVPLRSPPGIKPTYFARPMWPYAGSTLRPHLFGQWPHNGGMPIQLPSVLRPVPPHSLLKPFPFIWKPAFPSSRFYPMPLPRLPLPAFDGAGAPNILSTSKIPDKTGALPESTVLEVAPPPEIWMKPESPPVLKPWMHSVLAYPRPHGRPYLGTLSKPHQLLFEPHVNPLWTSTISHPNGPLWPSAAVRRPNLNLLPDATIHFLPPAHETFRTSPDQSYVKPLPFSYPDKSPVSGIYPGTILGYVPGPTRTFIGGILEPPFKPFGYPSIQLPHSHKPTNHPSAVRLPTTFQVLRPGSARKPQILGGAPQHIEPPGPHYGQQSGPWTLSPIAFSDQFRASVPGSFLPGKVATFSEPRRSRIWKLPYFSDPQLPGNILSSLQPKHSTVYLYPPLRKPLIGRPIHPELTWPHVGATERPLPFNLSHTENPDNLKASDKNESIGGIPVHSLPTYPKSSQKPEQQGNALFGPPSLSPMKSPPVNVQTSPKPIKSTTIETGKPQSPHHIPSGVITSPKRPFSKGLPESLGSRPLQYSPEPFLPFIGTVPVPSNFPPSPTSKHFIAQGIPKTVYWQVKPQVIPHGIYRPGEVPLDGHNHESVMEPENGRMKITLKPPKNGKPLVAQQESKPSLDSQHPGPAISKVPSKPSFGTRPSFWRKPITLPHPGKPWSPATSLLNGKQKTLWPSTFNEPDPDPLVPFKNGFIRPLTPGSVSQGEFEPKQSILYHGKQITPTTFKWPNQRPLVWSKRPVPLYIPARPSTSELFPVKLPESARKPAQTVVSSPNPNRKKILGDITQRPFVMRYPGHPFVGSQFFGAVPSTKLKPRPWDFLQAPLPQLARPVIPWHLRPSNAPIYPQSISPLRTSSLLPPNYNPNVIQETVFKPTITMLKPRWPVPAEIRKPLWASAHQWPFNHDQSIESLLIGPSGLSRPHLRPISLPPFSLPYSQKTNTPSESLLWSPVRAWYHPGSQKLQFPSQVLPARFQLRPKNIKVPETLHPLPPNANFAFTSELQSPVPFEILSQKTAQKPLVPSQPVKGTLKPSLTGGRPLLGKLEHLGPPLSSFVRPGTLPGLNAHVIGNLPGSQKPSSASPVKPSTVHQILKPTETKPFSPESASASRPEVTPQTESHGLEALGEGFSLASSLKKYFPWLKPSDFPQNKKVLGVIQVLADKLEECQKNCSCEYKDKRGSVSGSANLISEGDDKDYYALRSELVKTLKNASSEEEKQQFQVVKSLIQSDLVLPYLKEIHALAYKNKEDLLPVLLRKLEGDQSVGGSVKSAIRSYLHHPVDIVVTEEVKKHFKISDIMEDTLQPSTLPQPAQEAFYRFYNYVSNISGSELKDFADLEKIGTRGEFMKQLFNYFLEKRTVPKNIQAAISSLIPLIHDDNKATAPP